MDPPSPATARSREGVHKLWGAEAESMRSKEEGEGGGAALAAASTSMERVPASDGVCKVAAWPSPWDSGYRQGGEVERAVARRRTRVGATEASSIAAVMALWPCCCWLRARHNGEGGARDRLKAGERAGPPDATRPSSPAYGRHAAAGIYARLGTRGRASEARGRTGRLQPWAKK